MGPEPKAQDEPDQYEMMLYYGSFFIFTKSAVEALRASDGAQSPNLKNVQDKYFQNNIAKSPIFELLKLERDRIGHGDDAWACHPFKSESMLNRFINAGHDWSDAVFDEFWPEAPLKGEPIETVMNKVWRQVSNWLDAIDMIDQQHSHPS